MHCFHSHHFQTFSAHRLEFKTDTFYCKRGTPSKKHHTFWRWRQSPPLKQLIQISSLSLLASQRLSPPVHQIIPHLTFSALSLSSWRCLIASDSQSCTSGEHRPEWSHYHLHKEVLHNCNWTSINSHAFFCRPSLNATKNVHRYLNGGAPLIFWAHSSQMITYFHVPSCW